MDTFPGVTSAMALLPPFSGINGWDASYAVEGQSAAEAAEKPELDLQPILPDLLGLAGIPC